MDSWRLKDVRLHAGSDPVTLGIRRAQVVPAEELEEDVPSVDGGGGLLLRPFTDAHHHLDKAFTHLPGASLPPDIFSSIEATIRYKENMRGSPDAVAEGMVRVLEYLHQEGTRMVTAQIDVDAAWELTGFAAALAAREVFSDRMRVKLVAFPQHGMNDQIDALLREAAAMGADAIGGHTDIDDDWMSHLKRVARIADDSGLPVDIHVDETASRESYRLPGVLEIFGGRTQSSITHCISIAKLDAALRTTGYRSVAEAGLQVNVAPCVVGFGGPLFPVAEAIAVGVKVGVGSDNLRDLFMPTGSGSVHFLGKLLAIAQRIGDLEILDAIADGMTNGGWALATGHDDLGKPGSDASFQVCGILRPGELLMPPYHFPSFQVWRGRIEQKPTHGPEASA